VTQPPPGLPKAVRFGLFEVVFSQSELRKRGRKVLLQDQPFKLLALLLQRPGEIVTREELQQSLWPADTFVDFDESLNKAIQKLRQALGDSSDNPHVIETIPRRGYRFIAAVEPLDQDRPEGQTEEPRPPEPAEGVAPSSETVRRLRRERTLLVLALVAAIAVFIASWVRWPGPAPARLRKFAFASQRDFDTPVISPDGQHIAYIVANPADQASRTAAPVAGRLWIQDLDREAPREIDGTEGADSPFWSPDSEFVGFAAKKHLWKVPAQRGSPTPICELSDAFLGGTWSPDGRTIVLSIHHQGIYEVSAGGGVPKILIKVDRSTFGDHFDTPYLLPTPGGGRSLLYASQRIGGTHDIVLHSLESGKRSVLVPSAVDPVYSPTGHVLYTSLSGDLQLIMALPFSLATMKATGDAFPIARNGYSPSVASDGTLVYAAFEVGPQVQLTWHDRNGLKITTLGPAEDVGTMSLSPDGSSLALDASRNLNSDIWIVNATRGMRTRLTFSSQVDVNPIWSPTGKEITFRSNRQGYWDIYTTPADGSGEPKVLVAGRSYKNPNDWSPDGRFLVYQMGDPQGDLWYLKPKPDGKGYESVLLLRTAAAEGGARFSPDGQFLAYVSHESGKPEVYVRRFPDGSGVWQISANGGRQPSWRRDGKELFYVEGDTLASVSVATKPDFSIGETRRLFKSAFLTEVSGPGYGVSADGQRFLLAEPSGPVPPPVIRVVENWFAEFRDRAVRDR
jgi:eukaryotic-like serine/threonine-protein kinase